MKVIFNSLYGRKLAGLFVMGQRLMARKSKVMQYSDLKRNGLNRIGRRNWKTTKSSRLERRVPLLMRGFWSLQTLALCLMQRKGEVIIWTNHPQETMWCKLHQWLKPQLQTDQWCSVWTQTCERELNKLKNETMYHFCICENTLKICLWEQQFSWRTQ